MQISVVKVQVHLLCTLFILYVNMLYFNTLCVNDAEVAQPATSSVDLFVRLVSLEAIGTSPITVWYRAATKHAGHSEAAEQKKTGCKLPTTDEQHLGHSISEKLRTKTSTTEAVSLLNPTLTVNLNCFRLYLNHININNNN